MTLLNMESIFEYAQISMYQSHDFSNMEFMFDYRLACPNYMTLLNMESIFDYAQISMYHSEEFF